MLRLERCRRGEETRGEQDGEGIHERQHGIEVIDIDSRQMGSDSEECSTV